MCPAKVQFLSIRFPPLHEDTKDPLTSSVGNCTFFYQHGHSRSTFSSLLAASIRRSSPYFLPFRPLLYPCMWPNPFILAYCWKSRCASERNEPEERQNRGTVWGRRPSDENSSLITPFSLSLSSILHPHTALKLCSFLSKREDKNKIDKLHSPRCAPRLNGSLSR